MWIVQATETDRKRVTEPRAYVQWNAGVYPTPESDTCMVEGGEELNPRSYFIDVQDSQSSLLLYLCLGQSLTVSLWTTHQ